MRILFFLVAGLAVLAIACGDDDGEDLAYETFGPEERAYITGIEDGDLKYPRAEIWDQPECNYDRVLGNAVHGTEVRVIQKKTGCSQKIYEEQYEVELLEGDQTGMVGWLQAKFLHFGDEPPPGDLSD